MEASYARHNRLVASLVAGVLALVMAVTVAVDPVAIWGFPTSRGFNRYKSELHAYERLVKAQAVMRLRPRAIVLGSSRTRLAIRAERVAAPSGLPAYNLAMGSASIVECLAYLRHALALQPELAEVVLGTEYHQFAPDTPALLAKRGFDERRLGRAELPLSDVAAHTLTWSALADAYATVAANRRTPDAVGLGPLGDDLGMPWRAPLERADAREVFQLQIDNALRWKNLIEIDPAQLQALRELVALCREQRIRLTVFVTPIHAVEYELLAINQSWERVEAWKQELARIVPYWDFSGFNPVTTAPLGRQVAGYVDFTHARPEVGARMLARMHGDPGDSTFGRAVTASNVDAHLAAIRRERAAWERQDATGRVLAAAVAKARAGR